MKRIVSIILFSFYILLSKAQTVTIPDANFLSYLKTNFPAVINTSDELIISEAANITGTINCSNKSIASIEGIQYFTGITSLYAQDNLLTSVPDLSPITNLEVYQVHRNQITSLPSVASLSKLRLYYVYENKLTQLPDLRSNVLIEEVLAYKNNITSVYPFTGLSKITKLYLFDNLIDSIPDLTGLTSLENLQLQRNNIHYLPSLSDLTSLNHLQTNGNQLTSLPDLTNCTNIQNLIINSNKLTYIPSLSTLVNLIKIDAGGNQLTSFPSLSNNTLLQTLTLRYNKLSTLPNLNSLTQLTSVDIRNSNLSYEDFISILSHPNYSSSTFYTTPQNTLIIKDTIIYNNASITLLHNFDINLPGTTYQWYKDGTIITGSTGNSLVLSNTTTAQSGFYVCGITNSSFPSTSITAYTLLLTVMSCPNDANVKLDILKNISCTENGEIVVNMNNVYTSDISYTLTATIGNKSFNNTTGYFNDLDESQYNLSIRVSDQCSFTYSSPIYLSKERCNETFISPNGDNDKDEYVFEDMGNITIYDKNGRLVKSMATPGSWDGTDANGKLVPLGLYIVKNANNKIIYITVLY
ncbi:MAG: hypothetical protein U0U66_04320 [Cytophagaceae bacterium]